MLFQMAIADAYGIGFEFCKNTPDRPNNLSQYYQHPKYSGLKPGQYTDDTQRAIANARVVCYGNPYDPFSYMKEYLGVFRTNPIDGYSRQYQTLLQTSINCQGGEEAQIDYFNSSINRSAVSNGAIMGVAPLGYLESPQKVALAASIQALTTHGYETVPYAQAVALAAHYYIYDVKSHLAISVDDFLLAFLCTKDFINHKMIELGEVKMGAKETFKAVMWVLNNEFLMSDIIHKAVMLGGDTDSVAAISIAIASCNKEVNDDIPMVLKGKLLGNKEQLIGLDLRLRNYANEHR